MGNKKIKFEFIVKNILPWSLTKKLVVTSGGTCPLTPVTNGSDPRLLLSSSITWIYDRRKHHIETKPPKIKVP